MVRIGSISVALSGSRLPPPKTSRSDGHASSADVSGCGLVPSSWDSIACAVICSTCRWSSESTSRRPDQTQAIWEVSMSGDRTGSGGANRWVQLWLGVLCMVLIANLQYAWTLFVNPMHQVHGWTIAEIQVAFSILIATETWLTPIEGYIVDRLGPARGPRLMIMFGGALVGLAWVINAYADTLRMLYVGAALSGVGAGAIYATCVGNSVKWFPDRRGLAVGLTAGGFGAGAALTVVPIRMVIDAYGYASAFFWFGLVQGAVVFLLAWLMRAPVAGETPVV